MPPKVEWQEMCDVLDEAVHEAAMAALKIVEGLQPGMVRTKGPKDYVTAADLASQQEICAAWESLFPETPVVAEEQADPRITHDTYLAVDPVDGTCRLISGSPLWCLSLIHI